jgi:glyceraldehyde-3-phosphate dehydrogenase/erythrose-4-phosphate dehydrogenase
VKVLHEALGIRHGEAPSTMVVAGTQVKVLAWYDNEWGYANRLVELAALVGTARRAGVPG